MMALESTAPTLAEVFTPEVRAAMAERDERIRQQERDRILALLDDPATRKALGDRLGNDLDAHGAVLVIKHQIGGAA